MTDLSKAFDCLDYDLLIVKLDICRSDNLALAFAYSTFKDRKTENKNKIPIVHILI